MGMMIFLNGKKEELDGGSNIMGLLEKKNIRPEVVTVELNGKILERHSFQNTQIKEGDRVEFVYFMGGGQMKPRLMEQ
jgi:thiamine biosynthesis protein ThiS